MGRKTEQDDRPDKDKADRPKRTSVPTYEDRPDQLPTYEDKDKKRTGSGG